MNNNSKDTSRTQPSDSIWAIAIHGGAGAIARTTATDEMCSEYLKALECIVRVGAQALQAKSVAMDVAETVVRELEDDPLFNAGRGAVFTADETHELDACIMDGATLNSGAVTCVKHIRNPISLARLVLERSGHHLLAGDAAEAFAREIGMGRIEFVEQSYFSTEKRREQLAKAKEKGNTIALDHDIHTSNVKTEPEKMGTVGCVVRDVFGNLAAATSTGGMTNKRAGRVGDTPIAGAGNYADNATCAVSGTGKGEQFIQYTVCYRISALMAMAGLSLEQAVRQVVHETLSPGDGGVIAVDGNGHIVMDFNSEGMYRAAMDSNGLSVVGIWDEKKLD